MAIGLGASLNTVRDVRLSKLITANRTIWAPFDFPGQTGTAHTGQALEFDGVSDKIQIADIAIPDLNTFTMAMWVNFPNAITANYAPCFFIGDTGFNHQDHYALLGLISNDNQIAFSINKTNGGSRAAIKVYSDTLSTDTWYRVVGVYDGNADRIYLYVNGVLIGTDTPSDEAAWSAGDAVNFTGSNNDLFMSGGTGLNNSAALEFLGSDAQFWDKAWTDADALYDYNNPQDLVLDNPLKSIPMLTYSNLKLWYPMQDGDRGNQSFLLDGANTGLSDELVDNLSPNTGSSPGWFTALVSSNGWIQDSRNPGTWTVYTSGDGSFIIQSLIMSTSVSYTYKLTYTITNSSGSGSSAQLRLAGGNSAFGTHSVSGENGTHTYYLQSNASKGNLQFNENGFVGTISNISLLGIDLKNHGTSTFHGDELVSNGDSDSTLPTINSQNLASYDAASFAISTAITGSTAKYNGVAAGDDSILVTADSSSTYPLIRFLDGTDCGLVTGRTYYISCYVYIPASQTLDTVTLQALDNGGSTISLGDAGATTTTDTWVKLYGSYVSDDPQRCFEVRGSGGDVSDEIFYVDQISIREVGFATGWTDADAQATIPQLGFQSYNQLAWFDGTADHVALGSQSTGENKSITFSAWIYMVDSGSTAVQPIILLGDTHLRAQSDTSIKVYPDQGVGSTTITVPSLFNKWHLNPY